MGKADAIVAVGKLAVAFRQENIGEDTVALYTEKLADIPAPTLAAVVDRLIETQKFFPAIAEIRHAAARMCGLLPPSPAEIMALVRRADRREVVCRRDGSVAYTERFWDWPEDVDPFVRELAQDTLERVGEPCDENGKDHFGWETGFQKTYETQAEGVTRKVLSNLSNALLPAPALRQIAASGSGQIDAISTPPGGAA